VNHRPAVLGISAFGHDSAAALITPDGRLLAAEEERFSRVKFDRRFPSRALNFCLDELGDPADGYIAEKKAEIPILAGFYHNPWLRVGNRVGHVIRHLPGSVRFLVSYSEDVGGWGSMFGARRLIKRTAGQVSKSMWVEHHLAHAAGAFFSSPFEHAAICTLDGMGEWATTCFSSGRGSELSKLAECCFPHSLGIFYKTLTSYLGFRPNSDEYKVMGLAGYGEPEYAGEFRKILSPHDSGFFRLNLDYFSFHKGSNRLFSDLWIKRLGPPRHPGDEIETRHENIARSAQAVLEETVLKMLTALFTVTKEQNLCMSGGVALNSSLNGVIREKSPFERVWFQPPSGDSGSAIGICYYLKYVVLGEERNGECQRHLFLGPAYSGGDIRSSLDKFGLASVSLDNPEKSAARLLADGKVIAWFQGRMEFGPRALGNRSLLADPGLPGIGDRINRLVKHREPFRPFAPSVTEEHAGDLFFSPGAAGAMLYVVRAKEAACRNLPATVHVDGTSRVQVVFESTNKRFHSLLAEFERLTGRPGVLNTSFNLKDEPIVCSPDDAADSFRKSNIDGLIAGNHLAARSQRELGLLRKVAEE